jgi:hypothetical protein
LTFCFSKLTLHFEKNSTPSNKPVKIAKEVLGDRREEIPKYSTTKELFQKPLGLGCGSVAECLAWVRP